MDSDRDYVQENRVGVNARLTMHPIVLLLSMACLGCRAPAPIHVWEPGQVQTPARAKVALMPISGDPLLAERIEQAIFQQRPAAKADVALFSGEQLAQNSPVRLASTAAMNSDLLGLKAAQAIEADILVHGEILAHDIDLSDPEAPPEQVDWNNAFLQKRNDKQPEKKESLLLSLRVIDTDSRETLGAHSFTLHTKDARKLYPDLDASYPDDKTSMLIASSAREAWKLLSPTVTKHRVRLAVPWLQPGAWRVRRGVAAAKKGQWQVAETHFQKAADRFSFNASAQHNLAVALAAREDFAAAKKRLMKATGPLAIRLPGETLFWLDQQHRRYHEAHGIPIPIEGWSYPTPPENPRLIEAPPIDIADLPWWTAIPFTKRPE